MSESKERIAKRLRETQKFCSAVKEHLDENFLVEGKTMLEWKKHFLVEIPEDVTFQAIVNLGQEVWTKYQRAAYFRDSQQVQLAIMEQSKSDKYNTTYNDLRAETQQKTGKPLAAESCKIAATLAVKELDSAIANQKVIHTFWVKTCDTLTELRKILELMGYALSGDARIQRDFVIKGEHNGQR
jgi:hypothetical protein